VCRIRDKEKTDRQVATRGGGDARVSRSRPVLENVGAKGKNICRKRLREDWGVICFPSELYIEQPERLEVNGTERGGVIEKRGEGSAYRRRVLVTSLTKGIMGDGADKSWGVEKRPSTFGNTE